MLDRRVNGNRSTPAVRLIYDLPDRGTDWLYLESSRREKEIKYIRFLTFLQMLKLNGH